MMPPFYECKRCEKFGVKLWRKSHVDSPIDLLCAACASADAAKPVNLAECDQIGWWVPAVPTLNEGGGFWGYTSVPPEGVAWWQALPMQLEGEWPVKGGKWAWMPLNEGMDLHLTKQAELMRLEYSTHRALVFIKDKAA